MKAGRCCGYFAAIFCAQIGNQPIQADSLTDLNAAAQPFREDVPAPGEIRAETAGLFKTLRDGTSFGRAMSFLGSSAGSRGRFRLAIACRHICPKECNAALGRLTRMDGISGEPKNPRASDAWFSAMRDDANRPGIPAELTAFDRGLEAPPLSGRRRKLSDNVHVACQLCWAAHQSATRISSARVGICEYGATHILLAQFDHRSRLPLKSTGADVGVR